MTFKQFISNFHREESGQDLVEYALVLAAVALGVSAADTGLSTDFGTWILSLSNKINAYLT